MANANLPTLPPLEDGSYQEYESNQKVTSESTSFKTPSPGIGKVNEAAYAAARGHSGQGDASQSSNIQFGTSNATMIVDYQPLFARRPLFQDTDSEGDDASETDSLNSEEWDEIQQDALEMEYEFYVGETLGLPLPTLSSLFVD